MCLNDLGGWSSWDDWSRCSQTQSRRKRVRRCGGVAYFGSCVGCPEEHQEKGLCCSDPGTIKKDFRQFSTNRNEETTIKYRYNFTFLAIGEQ